MGEGLEVTFDRLFEFAAEAASAEFFVCFRITIAAIDEESADGGLVFQTEETNHAERGIGPSAD